MERVPFSVLIEARDGHIIANIAGELDMATSAIVNEQLQSHSGQWNRIVYELGDVSFIDSMAALTLFRSQDGGEVVLRNPTSFVRKVLGLLGLESIIED